MIAQPRNRRRRLLLALVLILAVADGLWLWTRRGQGEQQQYAIAGTTFARKIADTRTLPMFDDKTGSWQQDGKPLPALPIDSTGNGPDANSGFAVVRLSDNAGQTEFRHALLALARSGHCHAGIATRPTGEETIPIQQIHWARTDDGTIVKCQK